MGAMNVAMTVISLILIEKAGRKTLMLSGLSVMIICTTVLLICLKLAVSIFKKNIIFYVKLHKFREVRFRDFYVKLQTYILKCTFIIFKISVNCCRIEISVHCHGNLIRSWICNWSRIYSLVFCHWIIPTICKRHGNGHCCWSQLDCQFLGWIRIWAVKGMYQNEKNFP